MLKMCVKLFILSMCTLFFVISDSYGSVVFREDFDGSTLESPWYVEHNDTSYYSVSSGYLYLRANSGDMWDNATSYKNLFLVSTPTTGDFVMTVRVQQANLAISNFPQLNLLVYDNNDNNLRIFYAYSGASHYHFGINSEINQHSVSYAGVGLDFSTNPFYMRVEKEGNVYSAYYSIDGINFISPVSSITFGDSTPVSLGIAALVDPTRSSTFLIDSFEISDDIVPVTVPEPLSLVLMLVACLFGWARKFGKIYLS